MPHQTVKDIEQTKIGGNEFARCFRQSFDNPSLFPYLQYPAKQRSPAQVSAVPIKPLCQEPT